MSEHDHAAKLTHAHGVAERLRKRLSAVVRGRDEVIELVILALLADGHVLLEDYPGSGKTTLARALGESLDPMDVARGVAAFRRIQFTPDLLPSDITGTSVFEPSTGQLVFRPGPVFAHVLLADEINRTSPKVQSAMLEAMGEKQVTVDDTSHRLDELFFVIATQNPIDLAGTYPLPTPQLDRFLFKIAMKHIAREAELDLLGAYPTPSLREADALPRVARSEILAARAFLRTEIRVHALVREALVDLARAMRADARVLQGASTRALVLMLPALQARALLRGRDYVSPDDVQALARPVFHHRLECRAGDGDVADVVDTALRPILERLARASL